MPPAISSRQLQVGGCGGGEEYLPPAHTPLLSMQMVFAIPSTGDVTEDATVRELHTNMKLVPVKGTNFRKNE